MSPSSLERFGTVAFDMEVMRIACGLGCTSIELGNWIELIVPEVYRQDVREIVHEVGPNFIGRKVTPVSFDQFMATLQRTIWEKLEPR